MLRISIVSYLNSKPFLYGLRGGNFSMPVEISEDIPSMCAEKLKQGKADIGLVPVVVLPQLRNRFIISEYCIGADGKVGSVLLFSEVPIEKITNVLLDYQSKTSVMLARVLAKNYWRIEPRWKDTANNYETQIGGTTAGVVIGDRALKLKNKFPFVYDLATEWKKFTGLPFVFACWVSTRKLEESFVIEFNTALKNGLGMIESIAKRESNADLSESEIVHYFNDCIDYTFDDRKKNAMEKFLALSEDLAGVESDAPENSY